MKSLAPVALIFATALCGAATAQPVAGVPPMHHAPQCFWKRDIFSFAAHDDQHVYMRVGMHDVYELKLFSHCLDLSWVHHLGLRTMGDSNICEGPNPGVDVFVRDVGITAQRCPVTYIRKLTPAEVAALPKDAQP